LQKQKQDINLKNRNFCNDLIRLHLSLITTDKCYFIITGKTIHFQQDFKNYPNSGVNFMASGFLYIKGQSVTFDVAKKKLTLHIWIFIINS
jgi:hypothetical protein